MATLDKNFIVKNGLTVEGSTIISPAATTSFASLRIPHGTAPSTPTNGDLWTTTSGLFARINGSTIGPFGSTSAATPSALGTVYGSTPTTGDNTALGYLAFNAVTSGQLNTAVGKSALGAITTGGGNTAIGASALASSTNGTNNTAIGYLAMGLNAGGSYNVAIGSSALYQATNSATFNIAIGQSAMYTSTSGSHNIAMGFETLRNNSTGSNNIALGYYVLNPNTTGTDNVAIGYRALDSSATTSNNIAIGTDALGSHTSGNGLVAVGYQALALNTTGTKNTAFGFNAGDKIDSGAQNTIIGSDAASSGTNDLTTGSNNIVIGYNAETSGSTVSNEIVIGNSSNNRLRVPGLGIDWTSSTVPASPQEIIPLDDISNQFNGQEIRFIPTYQGSQITISNPFRLLLTINGIMQYIDSPDYVWMSGVPRRGLFVDNDGYLQFSEAVPAGSEFDARLMPGAVTTTRTRTYPFKALDIVLGG